MSDKDLEFCKHYNPLANALRQVPLKDSLYVVWNYYRNITREFGFKFPKDIESHISIMGEHLDELKIRLTTSEWHLETFAREIIINSDLGNHTRESLRQYHYFSKTFNKLKTLDNESSGIYSSQQNVFRDMYRIIHNQFHWGRYHNLDIYTEIFSSPSITAHIASVFGVSGDKVLIIGFALYVQFLHGFHHLEFHIEKIPGISKNDVEKVLAIISKPIEEVRVILKNEHQLNEKFFVYKDSLSVYPILTFTDEGRTIYVSPIPQLIYWRLFNGLYYDVLNKKGFDKAFGDAFQKYITDRSKQLNTVNKLGIFEETEYDGESDKKRTIDIQVSDDSANLFVECKTKRLRQSAKQELLSEEEILSEVNKLLDAVVQGYKTISDYKSGFYPKERINDKPNFLLVVTLEDWLFPFINTFKDIAQTLKEKIEKEKLSFDITKEIPYFICSAIEYENLIYLVSNQGIYDVLNKKISNPEYANWSMHTFLVKNYVDFFKKYPKPQSHVFERVVGALK